MSDLMLQGENTIQRIERAVKSAEWAQSTSTSDHATVIDQLNQQVPIMEIEIGDLKENLKNTMLKFQARIDKVEAEATQFHLTWWAAVDDKVDEGLEHVQMDMYKQ